MAKAQDNVDRIRREWADALPGLDTSSLEITGRILDLATRLEASATEVLDQFDLGSGDFSVLVTLRRIGKAGGLSPGQITEATMVSAGATTQRLDRLDAAELIERHPDPADRRGQCIRLTRKGKRIAERSITAVTEAERAFLAAISEQERSTLTKTLRTLTTDRL